MHLGCSQHTALPHCLLLMMTSLFLPPPAEHLDEWRVLYDSAAPQSEPLPGDWQGRLDAFQRLLLLRAMRQDKLTPAIMAYVAEVMGGCVAGNLYLLTPNLGPVMCSVQTVTHPRDAQSHADLC